MARLACSREPRQRCPVFGLGLPQPPQTPEKIAEVHPKLMIGRFEGEAAAKQSFGFRRVAETCAARDRADGSPPHGPAAPRAPTGTPRRPARTGPAATAHPRAPSRPEARRCPDHAPRPGKTAVIQAIDYHEINSTCRPPICAGPEVATHYSTIPALAWRGGSRLLGSARVHCPSLGSPALLLCVRDQRLIRRFRCTSFASRRFPCSRPDRARSRRCAGAHRTVHRRRLFLLPAGGSLPRTARRRPAHPGRASHRAQRACRLLGSAGLARSLCLEGVYRAANGVRAKPQGERALHAAVRRRRHHRHAPQPSRPDQRAVARGCGRRPRFPSASSRCTSAAVRRPPSKAWCAWRR